MHFNNFLLCQLCSTVEYNEHIQAFHTIKLPKYIFVTVNNLNNHHPLPIYLIQKCKIIVPKYFYCVSYINELVCKSASLDINIIVFKFETLLVLNIKLRCVMNYNTLDISVRVNYKILSGTNPNKYINQNFCFLLF